MGWGCGEEGVWDGGGEEVRWTGLRVRGGGGGFLELVVLVVVVVVDGEREGRRGRGGGVGSVPVRKGREGWERLGVAEAARDGVGGGGSLRGGLDEGRGGSEDMLLWEGGRGGMRGTVTQSGSSVGANGFEGRFGFGMAPGCGGLRSERAGRPLSSHHFRLSELAGGRPGSIGS
jgi:hypothetical protein